VLAFVPKADPPPRTEPAEGDQGSAIPATATGLTPRQGFVSPSFYLLFGASLVSAMTGVALVLNLVPVLTFTGLTRIDAVAIAGSMGLASIFGRIVGGWLMDRYDVRQLAIYAALASLAFPLTLLF